MNDVLMCRVWDKVDNAYWSEEIIKANAEWLLFPNDNIENVIVERSTGLKDKNGNLIYEGDIIDCELQNIDSHGYPFIYFKKGVVKRAKNGAYCAEGDDDFYASDITLYPIEIIGNIHETKDNK